MEIDTQACLVSAFDVMSLAQMAEEQHKDLVLSLMCQSVTARINTKIICYCKDVVQGCASVLVTIQKICALTRHAPLVVCLK